ncbi:MAG: molybdenum cofactor guanylyltransferase [Desulfatiglans sp.]|jgi:molybdopterin-guanine dinucleotide biosynthesis protein A|nr:molybdenum cofactor guanylyltransferase [Thermodesulfobacteriota bacterium]MEE4351462.1 molybdenum cofactor guanylyltransferase [Desulfatiglans sp.]
MSDASKDSKIPFHDIAAVILAGGKSSRFGRNKALEKIDGIPLIEKVIDVMGSLFKHLMISTNTPEDYSYLNLPMHEDLIQGLGPLGGIYTALETMKQEGGFVVACDMPYLNGDLIRHMVEIRGDFDVVVPKIDWKVEPLHCLYKKSCLPAIKRSIESGSYQILHFFSEVSVRYVGAEELRPFDPEFRSFFNINRPQEVV